MSGNAATQEAITTAVPIVRDSGIHGGPDETSKGGMAEELCSQFSLIYCICYPPQHELCTLSSGTKFQSNAPIKLDRSQEQCLHGDASLHAH